MSGEERRRKPGSPASASALGLAVLLLAAAGLKLTDVFLHTGNGNRPWHLVLGAGEILLGLWLLSGRRREWSLCATAAVFFCFGIVTLRMIEHGATDCGCFGPLSLSPRTTYWIDITALLMALSALKVIRFRVLLPLILLPGVVLYFGTRSLAQPLHPISKIGVGQSWPSEKAIECPADLSKGRWVVLIHGSDCVRCQSMAEDYAREASRWGVQGKRTRLALLDADQSGSPANPSFPQIVRGSLLSAGLYDHTPILLLLDQGKVLRVEEGWGVVDWSDPAHGSWIQ
jgi:hypothetical protein